MSDSDLKILLSELRSLPGETEWVEFKRNNATELGEYISALSNSACLQKKDTAYIIFGVDDKTHRIVGTNFSLHQKAKGNEDLIPWISRLLEPRINVQFHELHFDDQRVVIGEIQAAKNTPVKFGGEAFIRIGSYKKKLDDYPEKQRLIWTNGPTENFETGIAITALRKSEILDLLNFESYFEMNNLLLPASEDGIIEKLLQEKLISNNRGKFDVTNLGAILFARRLDQFNLINRKAIRVVQYKGNSRLKTKKEQLGQKGYACGFAGILNYINEQLPINEEIGRAFRKDVRVFPELALRELIANALIHQDFSEHGTGPMIEIFENRVEITNPGKPLISTMRFVDHNPQSRNEKLAYFMRRLKICEERGSGIDKVIYECEYHQLPAPKFIEGENYTRVILYAYRTFSQMDKDEKMRACYLHACLKYVQGETMTNTSLRQRFGIAEKNYSMVSRIISEAIKLGLVKEYDAESKSKKHSKYIPFWA